MWCKTIDGHMINLSKAISIHIIPGEKASAIVASFEAMLEEEPVSYTLYVGENVMDCREVIDLISRRLDYLDLSDD